MATAKTAASEAPVNGEKTSSWLKNSYKSATSGATARSSEFALRVNDFQRTAFERIMETVGAVQDSVGESMHTFARDVNFVPPEGAKLVEEWSRLVKRGRQDFVDSTVKSYDLVGAYLERVKVEAKQETA